MQSILIIGLILLLVPFILAVEPLESCNNAGGIFSSGDDCIEPGQTFSTQFIVSQSQDIDVQKGSEVTYTFNGGLNILQGVTINFIDSEIGQAGGSDASKQTAGKSSLGNNGGKGGSKNSQGSVGGGGGAGGTNQPSAGGNGADGGRSCGTVIEGYTLGCCNSKDIADGGKGGSAGAIIRFLGEDATLENNGVITVNGRNGENGKTGDSDCAYWTLSMGGSGAGGGGGGGTIYVDMFNLIGSGKFEAIGGNGGNGGTAGEDFFNVGFGLIQDVRDDSGSGGAGGGGNGGTIVISSFSLSSTFKNLYDSLKYDVSGGIGGSKGSADSSKRKGKSGISGTSGVRRRLLDVTPMPRLGSCTEQCNHNIGCSCPEGCILKEDVIVDKYETCEVVPECNNCETILVNEDSPCFCPVECLLAEGTIIDPGEGCMGSGYDINVSYNFSPDGKLLEIQDPMGRSIKNYYDLLGYRIGTETPDSGYTKIGYDAVGNLIKIEDERGVVRLNEYDSVGRIMSVYLGDLYE